MDSRLYQASVTGNVNVNTWNQLIHDISNNPLILENATVGRWNQNPLHIAASAGHLDFTIALLRLNTNLVTNLVTKSDSRGRLPLHLASGKGHFEIVRVLLLHAGDAGVCLKVDQEGRIPLHLAAMQGHVNVVRELIGARPDSITVPNKESTVLHLCVRYNRLEALKLLLELAPDDSLVCARDNDGNTVLHLAVALQNKEIIKYLLSLPDVKGLLAKMMNKENFTALDVSEQYGKSIEIQDILHKAGVSRSERPKALKILRFMEKHLTMDDDWLKNSRGHLLTTSTVIATVAFQAGVTPPGGVWQDDDVKGSFNNTTQGSHEAGTSIIATKYSSLHTEFVFHNTFSFATSISVILLLISGVAFKNKFLMGILHVAIFSSILFMVGAYSVSVKMMIPDPDSKRTLLVIICDGATYICYAVLLFYWLFSFEHMNRKYQSQPDGS